ncbi:MAG: heme exporter protein [Actinomycetota bacterium]|nr:heme exporter protein [Actinomycetota bacterium]
MIEAKSLRVQFGRTLALDSVDIRLGPGITGLFGQNGSGKTTLLRTLAGLQRPTTGEVTLDGSSPRDPDERVRGSIGYVGHPSGLYTRLTVAENLGLFAKLHGISVTRPSEMIELLDLGRWANTSAGDLSAGLSRRTAVARALLHEPRFLFLDEPYANLDDDAAQIVSDAIVAWRSDDRYALIATHGAKRVKAYADGGLILKRGRVSTQGIYVHEEAKI